MIVKKYIRITEGPGSWGGAVRGGAAGNPLYLSLAAAVLLCK